MSETKHSPGPWEVLFPPSANSYGFIAASDSEEIAVVMNFSLVRHCGLPDIANGNLIAAAPDLLAALSDIMDNHEPHSYEYRRVSCNFYRRVSCNFCGFGLGSFEAPDTCTNPACMGVKARAAIAKATGAGQ